MSDQTIVHAHQQPEVVIDHMRRLISEKLPKMPLEVSGRVDLDRVRILGRRDGGIYFCPSSAGNLMIDSRSDRSGRVSDQILILNGLDERLVMSGGVGLGELFSAQWIRFDIDRSSIVLTADRLTKITPIRCMCSMCRAEYEDRRARGLALNRPYYNSESSPFIAPNPISPRAEFSRLFQQTYDDPVEVES